MISAGRCTCWITLAMVKVLPEKQFTEVETGGYWENGIGRQRDVEGMNDFLETRHTYIDAGMTEA